MSQFNKTKKALMRTLANLEGQAIPAESLMYYFNNDEEVALAVFVQNIMHPKNSNRVEAVKSGTYVEIENLEHARLYLSHLLRTNLQHELNAVENEVAAEIAALAQMHDVKVLLEAPDVFVAAAAMNSMQFYMGKGDRTAFFNIVLSTDPSKIPDLGRKLQLITSNQFMGLKFYNDKICSAEKVNMNMIYRMWLHTRRRYNVVTLEQLIEWQPQAEEKLRCYDRFVDAEGKTTLNPEEYIAYRVEMAEKAKVKKKAKNQPNNFIMK